MASTLAPECLHIVFTHLRELAGEEANSALVACALVCKAWTVSAQHILYDDVNLIKRDEKTHQLLLESLQKRDYLSQMIKSGLALDARDTDPQIICDIMQLATKVQYISLDVYCDVEGADLNKMIPSTQHSRLQSFWLIGDDTVIRDNALLARIAAEFSAIKARGEDPADYEYYGEDDEYEEDDVDLPEYGNREAASGSLVAVSVNLEQARFALPTIRNLFVKSPVTIGRETLRDVHPSSLL